MKEIVSLDSLVSEIKFFENQAVVSYWEIGKRLAQAKEQVGHGNWLKWVDDNLGYSERTTQQLIKVYQSYPNTNMVSDLKFRQVLALTTVEEETRQEILEKENLEDKTVKETQEIIRRYKEEKRDLEEENKELRQANAELSNMKPKIVTETITKEIIPDDYDSIKNENEKLHTKLECLSIEITNMKLAKKKEAEESTERTRKQKITDDVNDFVWQANNFIGRVGGLLYLTDYVKDMTGQEKELFFRAVRSLAGWSYQLKENIRVLEEA